jgi:transposase InsO family protein
MPWRKTDVKNERISFVVGAKQKNRNMSALCREFGISRKTGYKWLNRFHEGGNLDALEDLSRRPHNSPNQTSEAIERRVEEIRRITGWGGKKLQLVLASEGIHLAASTIDRIIQRRGLTRECKRDRKATQRFERTYPNELWQMDFKGKYRLKEGGDCHPLSVLDDHSRYNVGLFALSSIQTSGVQRSLIDCFERCGVPEAMLLDHGIPWWSNSNGHGLTKLSVFLIKQGIDLIYGASYHPQTRGKVERFHRTLDETLRYVGLPHTFAGFRAAFASFSQTYNDHRPHESLDMQVPAKRYTPSPRAYNPSPAPWVYPSGTEVSRLNSAGCLEYKGNRYFVCEALANDEVGYQTFSDRILVTYRHMYIREINLSTGRTKSLVQTVDS